MGVAELLSLASRWLHIVAAITAVGGAIFALLVVLPATGVLTPEAREAFHAAVRKRWSKIVAAAIAVLLLSGLYNFFAITRNYGPELPRWYHALFGIKFLLALAVFAIASLLAGRTAMAQRLRTQTKLWLSINLLLAGIIIAISGLLRTTHPATGPAPAGRASEAPSPIQGPVVEPKADEH
jgi:uncharacterized membrane protein